jgi:hypothetical protein
MSKRIYTWTCNLVYSASDWFCNCYRRSKGIPTMPL